jgi:hypothetical protein
MMPQQLSHAKLTYALYHSRGVCNQENNLRGRRVIIFLKDHIQHVAAPHGRNIAALDLFQYPVLKPYSLRFHIRNRLG